MPFGDGDIDNADLLRRVASAGYDGFLVVEVEVEDAENTPAYVRAARPYLRALLDTL